MHRKHVECTTALFTFTPMSMSGVSGYFLYYTGSVDARRKHVKSALWAGSFSHWSMSVASSYFYTTLDQWMHSGSMLSPHYSLVHFHTG